MKKIQGGVCAAQGYMAAHTAAGIKYKNRNDMALIYSTVKCVAAGTFTSNIVKAAPVIWDREIVTKHQNAQAVVINAGIANACTGEEGMDYCRQTARACAKSLQIEDDMVLVASTGVIGMQLPMEKIIGGIQKMSTELEATNHAGAEAACAIMTTDTHSKVCAVTIELGEKTVTIGGMSKGSGMIHPNMCTMLSFVTTDCNISKNLLQEALSYVVEDTYNMISVDGDTSTNDTCLLLANGLAENELITEKNADYELFVEALMEVNRNLAMQMAGDGEGATALFEVKVVHANTITEAKILAKSVITSNLTKAAIFGHDANWGRILCALGYAGVNFDPQRIDLMFESEYGSLFIIRDGIACDYSEEDASRILSASKVTAICDMKQKDAQATAWGCDLTYDYVKINADYRS